MNPVVVHKGRTVTLRVSLGYDASADVFASQIRTEKHSGSELIAEWDVSFYTDGSDGELVLTLDDSVSGPITKTTGYMDIKRVTGGEPVPVFDDPIEVLFKETITA